jgi:hypothetical protein
MSLPIQNWLFLALFLLVSGLSALPAQAGIPIDPDLFDLDHGLAFAQYLEQEGRLDLALEEYRRVDRLAPGRLDVRMAILRLCNVTGRPAEGMVAYERWDYHPYLVPPELRRRYVGLFFAERALDRLERKLGDGLGFKDPERTRVDLHLALYRHDWERARGLYERFEIQHVKRHRMAYAPIMAAVDEMRYRKPWLGTVLSIVPGGGQCYAGQWVDGIGSLLLVGLTGLESYRLFHKRGPANVLAWGLAGLSASFYIANLYGGHRAAHRYNARQDAGIEHALDGLTARDF